MPLTITVHESLVIDRSPEVVWDFTQDFSRRPAWDSAVRQARVIQTNPVPRVEVQGQAGFRAFLQYKQFDRPRQTSLAMEEIRSGLIVGGGGSWSYERHGAGTKWTQVNSITLRDGIVAKLIAPLVRWQLRRSTIGAMKRAKSMIEAAASARR